MKPSLQVRLSQHLALTPQLQQSIRLLQLSTLELHQEVEQMLEQNPFLEAEEETPTIDEPPQPEYSAPQRDEYVASDEGRDDTQAPVDAAEFGTTEREDWANGTEGDDFDGVRELPSLTGSGSASSGDDDFEPQERNAHGPTLAEHLLGQLAGMRLSPEERAAIHVLIESLNEDGYLADSLEDIAAGILDGRRRRRPARTAAGAPASRTQVAAEPGTHRHRRARSARMPDAATARVRTLRSAGGGDHHLQAAPRPAGAPRLQETRCSHWRR